MLSLFLYMGVLTISKAYVNIGLHKPAYQHKPLIREDMTYDASNAVDGRKSDQSWEGGKCAVSLYNNTAIWWVNLITIYSIHHITIYFMTDDLQGFYADLYLGFSVYVSNTTDILQGTLCFKDNIYTKSTLPSAFTTNCFVHGRYVIYYNERIPGVVYPDDYSRAVKIALCEVEVYGCSITGFYRSNCSTPCPDVSCQYCHIETGTCQGCKPGYQGHRCEIEPPEVTPDQRKLHTLLCVYPKFHC